ncbi:MAG: hypothetical protein GWO41_12320 [candidate division Zixibacteria bacterium]|nr:hypothetical protein [candidate division Zixibacteria bacterium]NIR66052.1 hypothetical protein [candidate division Zixibacteria bacterium]NIS17136.1 hypothetical protein [candidate division Zixibacteria bacterium]NIS47682.1 hypothetical protein [candidate division Zixibacteria bacterium]NIT53491.1 hypothetical protein [candidate division Zixibacteria bacterium]
MVITVGVEGGSLPEGNSIGFFYKPARLSGQEGEIAYTRYEMRRAFNNPDCYEITIPRGEKGDKVLYYIELDDAGGNEIATLTSEQGAGDTGETWLMFANRRHSFLFVGHVLVMLASFLFVSLAFLTSLSNLKNTENNIILGKQILWAVIFILIGLVPLGIVLNSQMYGTYWQGLPLGNYITGSLGFAIFAYWLIMLILMKGSAFMSDPSKNVLSPSGMRLLTVIGFLITAVGYLVPHGIGEF